MTFLQHQFKRSDRETAPDDLKGNVRTFGEYPTREKRDEEEG